MQNGVRSNHELLGESIYQKLWSRLVSQNYLPESRLSIDQLSRELNVSQTPIRQALVRLQSEGLVINRKNAGFSVAPLPSKATFIASLEFRLIAEPAAARLCTRNITETNLIELQTTLRQLEDSVIGDADAYGKFSSLDLTFHDKIAELSGNVFLRQALLELRRKMVVFRMSFAPGLRRALQGEHDALFQAIADRSEQRAFDAMYQHIHENIRRVETATDA